MNFRVTAARREVLDAHVSIAVVRWRNTVLRAFSAPSRHPRNSGKALSCGARALVRLLCLLALPVSTHAGNGFLEMRNGYFWDPATGDYFIPRGVAYQIWNPPVGANQSTNQVDYDLLEFKKMRANSVRAEMTWGQVEVGPNQFDWTKPDYLVKRAEELGLKLFIIIGYQYPPSWFPPSWRGVHNLGLREDVLACLANSYPSNAISCLPPRMASFLMATNSPQTLAQVLSCLVTGARAGGISNILECLQTTLTPDELNANLPYLISDVINYEDPRAQAVYSNYISAVTARYKDSPAIGAWILGNEYAYFDLWEDNQVLYKVHRFLGYDPQSQKSFRQYLQSFYHTNTAALNTNWQTNYAGFESVAMPLAYPPDRHFPGYQDLLQWRKQSIGRYVAVGALAAQQADPNHLRTYAMLGGIFSGQDANYTCEDAKAIVAACAAVGAPLHFWSINNYPWALFGSEMRSAAFGIGKYQAESGLPVMISEAGFSSTEDLFDYDSATGYSYSGARQPKALPSTIWESLLSGAIGVHFFNWNDRSQFTNSYFPRERGFGIVQENRLPKHPVYDNIVAMFREMENIHLDHLLGGSSGPPLDVQLFWSTNADMVWPRANQENAMIWGALKRLGLQPGIIDDEGFERGAFTNAPVLLLSRCYQMDPLQLERVATEVIPAGIHVHAETDLPGQYDAYDRPNPNWTNLMGTIFGVDVSHANLAFDLIVTQDCSSPIHLRGMANLGPITPSYTADLATWKLWRNVIPVSAKTILTVSGTSLAGGCNPYLDVTPYPALLVNSNGPGRGKTAVNPFAVGDTYGTSGTESGQWDIRYAVLHAIYRDHFGLKPKIDLSGPGSDHVLSTYRICANGSVAIALLNEDTNAAVLTISSPALLAGRTVEDLFLGSILARNSTGSLTYTNRGDDCVVLYAYPSTGSQDDSLINSNPNKLWFQATPLVVWPDTSPFNVTIGYDAKDPGLSLTVSLDEIWPRQRVCSQTTITNVVGSGRVGAQLLVPDADANDPTYLSSHEGGQYVFHASLSKPGISVTDLTLPVRVVFGVHPLHPFPALVPGRTYPIELAWEELPSYAAGDSTLLDRVNLWDSLSAGQEHYNIVLELNSGGLVVVSNAFLTTQGTGSNTFSITVPAGASGPFTWNAYVQTATNVLSHNVVESFEGYERGANYNAGQPYITNFNFLAPWVGAAFPPYSPPPAPLIELNKGVQLEGSDGSQSAFFVATKPASVTLAAFFLVYEFPHDWALPADPSQWTNYLFSYDFKESHGYLCSVEMQVKNADPMSVGEWIQYTNLYTASNQWVTIKATLDQFQPSGLGGVFDPTNVHAIVLNIRMLVSDVQYVGSFDNIQFRGPEVNQGGGNISSFYTSANDSLGWLNVETGASGHSVSWIGNGVLQIAPTADGPWTDTTNAPNPFPVTSRTSQQFYRLRR